ncbi:hypothetical protein [Dyadobacter sp. 3J3]|uniref:hypothetical protein n=1 Tax=Dyadobacter sp. 3J3 TaxID=2606600 RepID=UPI001E3D525B|nr:hypothetical protein [Dyadobacter sp. 3J3]
MNSSQIFELALGLSKPWFVKDLKMIVGEGRSHGQMDIYLDFERGFKCTDLSGNELITHDTVERTWQHLIFFSTPAIYTHVSQG